MPQQYFIKVDDLGTPLQFYLDIVNSTVPSTAMPISEEQWQSLIVQPFQRLVNGELVSYTPPSPSIQRQAILLLNNPVITVTCASIPELNGTYSVGGTVRPNITGIAVAINGGLGLPSGASTFLWTDQTGAPHSWPADKFILFAHGVMVYIYNLTLVAEAGGTLPSAVIAI
jgi:hypothetical protein